MVEWRPVHTQYIMLNPQPSTIVGNDALRIVLASNSTSRIPRTHFQLHQRVGLYLPAHKWFVKRCGCTGASGGADSKGPAEAEIEIEVRNESAEDGTDA